VSVILDLSARVRATIAMTPGRRVEGVDAAAYLVAIAGAISSLLTDFSYPKVAL
jgi:hypothetical protein